MFDARLWSCPEGKATALSEEHGAWETDEQIRDQGDGGMPKTLMGDECSAQGLVFARLPRAHKLPVRRPPGRSCRTRYGACAVGLLALVPALA